MPSTVEQACTEVQDSLLFLWYAIVKAGIVDTSAQADAIKQYAKTYAQLQLARVAKNLYLTGHHSAGNAVHERITEIGAY